MNTKPTNPKDAISCDKAPLELCPDTLTVAASMAFLEGALKYGRFNWRVAGVRASVYRGALMRHLFSWWNGEEIDPASGLPHLYKAAACVAILIDATACDSLTDDRPPSAPVGEMLTYLEPHVKRLRKDLAKHEPKQYTIADSKLCRKSPTN